MEDHGINADKTEFRGGGHLRLCRNTVPEPPTPCATQCATPCATQCAPPCATQCAPRCATQCAPQDPLDEVSTTPIFHKSPEEILTHASIHDFMEGPRRNADPEEEAEEVEEEVEEEVKEEVEARGKPHQTSLPSHVRWKHGTGGGRRCEQ